MGDNAIPMWAPCVRPVILSHEQRGRGIEGDPVRRVLQVHDLNGKFIAEEPDKYLRQKGGE